MPDRFYSCYLMQVTGWSWTELMETDAGVVRDHELFLRVSQVATHGGDLDLGE